jgi:antitoxin component of RelBE/YafQ-DinJ toxin-antitoxin module
MKNETITIRIEDELKNDFQCICNEEHTDMSDKLYEYIITEIKAKKNTIINTNFENIFKSFGYTNVFIVNLVINKIDNKEYQLMTLRLSHDYTLSDFLKDNQNKKTYIYLSGSDLPIMIRYFTID